MKQKIHVAHLPREISEDELYDLFEQYGVVHDVALIHNSRSDRLFAFVEMEESDGQRAVDALDGTDYGGRTLRVSQATTRGVKETDYTPGAYRMRR
jgi:RNA recognition motif-containing protein